jgi:ABC-type Fe3+ transport system permease subunit
MSKPEGPHDAVKQAITPKPGKPPSRLQTAIQVFTALSLFFVVMTPITYFVGRAYHDGWYDALGLDGSLFPLDTATMLTQGFMVAENGFGKLATASLQAVGAHFVLLVSVLLTAALTWAVFKWLEHRLDERSASKAKKPAQDQHVRQKSLRFLIINAILTALLVVFSFYEVVFGVWLLGALITEPFYQLGKYDAKQIAAKGFTLSPMVTVKSPTGDVKRREIGCGPAYCALWGDGHASQAPIASVGWADAQPPAK